MVGSSSGTFSVLIRWAVIKKPMDLTTVLRNVKARKYKNKDDFSSDLGLIWENCFTYNTHEVRTAVVPQFSQVLTLDLGTPD